MDAARIQELLPWRQPFLMIDRMVSCTPHDNIATAKRVTAGDSALHGAVGRGGPDGLVGPDCAEGSDCPDGPDCEDAWFPAVLLLEGINQSAALLYVLSYGACGGPRDLPLLGFLSARLDGSAAVGECVRYEVRSQKMTRRGGVFSAQAHAEGRLLVTAEVAFSMAREEEGPR